MPTTEYLEILNNGVAEWNQWRQENFEISPWLADVNFSRGNLSGVNLSNVNLSGANFSKADLSKANLDKANLFDANLRKANLSKATLYEANLCGANFSGATLSEADLSHANLSKANFLGAKLTNARLIFVNLAGANLVNADLTDVNLSGANLVSANFTDAKLQGCRIYGISVWKTTLKNAHQKDLIITPFQEYPIITVDNLEVAQFIYLLLNNEKIRDVIDTITSKVVLILGRFTPERKVILDAIRDELRAYNYLPLMFDFEKPANRNIIETVTTLAHMARFVIADLTDARTVAAELSHFVPMLKAPVQPLLQSEAKEYAWTEGLKDYPWFLPIYYYGDLDDLKKSLYTKVIKPSEQYLRK